MVRTLQIDQAGRRTSGGQVGQGRERGQVRRGERGRGAVQGHAARRAGGENIGPPDADTAQGRAARIVPERRRDGHGRQHVFESESAQGADSDCRWRWRRRAMIIIYTFCTGRFIIRFRLNLFGDCSLAPSVWRESNTLDRNLEIPTIVLWCRDTNKKYRVER